MPGSINLYYNSKGAMISFANSSPAASKLRARQLGFPLAEISDPVEKIFYYDRKTRTAKEGRDPALSGGGGTAETIAKYNVIPSAVYADQPRWYMTNAAGTKYWALDSQIDTYISGGYTLGIAPTIPTSFTATPEYLAYKGSASSTAAVPSSSSIVQPSTVPFSSSSAPVVSSTAPVISSSSVKISSASSQAPTPSSSSIKVSSSSAPVVSSVSSAAPTYNVQIENSRLATVNDAVLQKRSTEVINAFKAAGFTTLDESVPKFLTSLGSSAQRNTLFTLAGTEVNAGDIMMIDKIEYRYLGGNRDSKDNYLVRITSPFDGTVSSLAAWLPNSTNWFGIRKAGNFNWAGIDVNKYAAYLKSSWDSYKSRYGYNTASYGAQVTMIDSFRTQARGLAGAYFLDQDVNSATNYFMYSNWLSYGAWSVDSSMKRAHTVYLKQYWETFKAKTNFNSQSFENKAALLKQFETEQTTEVEKIDVAERDAWVSSGKPIIYLAPVYAYDAMRYGGRSVFVNTGTSAVQRHFIQFSTGPDNIFWIVDANLNKIGLASSSPDAYEKVVIGGEPKVASVKTYETDPATGISKLIASSLSSKSATSSVKYVFYSGNGASYTINGGTQEEADAAAAAKGYYKTASVASSISAASQASVASSKSAASASSKSAVSSSSLPAAPQSSTNSAAIASSSSMAAQLKDLQAQQAALQKYGLTDTNQLVKQADGTYVPKIVSSSSKVVSSSSTVSANSATAASSSSAAVIAAQLKDLQAQQAALQKYGLTDTNLLVKQADGSYLPKVIPSSTAPDTTTTSLVNYLQSVKLNSSFTNRAQMAVLYGVTASSAAYTGTAAQNTALLAKIKAAMLSSSAVATPTQPSASSVPSTVSSASSTNQIQLDQVAAAQAALADAKAQQTALAKFGLADTKYLVKNTSTGAYELNAEGKTLVAQQAYQNNSKSIDINYVSQSGVTANQTTLDCGPAALLQLLQAKGLTGKTVNDVFAQTGASANSNISYGQLESAASKLGYGTKLLSNQSTDALKTLINQGIAVMILVNGTKLTKPVNNTHFVVVRGYTPDGFIIDDPQNGANILEKNLAAAWSTASQLGSANNTLFYVTGKGVAQVPVSQSSLASTPSASSMGPNELPDITRNLELGMSGADVTALQNWLKVQGYFPPDVDCTGYYGNITAQSVEAWQRAVGLNAEPNWGYFGPKSIATMLGKPLPVTETAPAASAPKMNFDTVTTQNDIYSQLLAAYPDALTGTKTTGASNLFGSKAFVSTGTSKSWLYTLKSGETLSTIIERYGTTLSNIMYLNSGRSLAQLSKPGAQIQLPTIDASKAKTITISYQEDLRAALKKIYSGGYGQTGAREAMARDLLAVYPYIDVWKDINARVPAGWDAVVFPQSVTAREQLPVYKQTVFDQALDIVSKTFTLGATALNDIVLDAVKTATDSVITTDKIGQAVNDAVIEAGRTIVTRYIGPATKKVIETATEAIKAITPDPIEKAAQDVVDIISDNVNTFVTETFKAVPKVGEAVKTVLIDTPIAIGESVGDFEQWVNNLMTGAGSSEAERLRQEMLQRGMESGTMTDEELWAQASKDPAFAEGRLNQLIKKRQELTADGIWTYGKNSDGQMELTFDQEKYTKELEALVGQKLTALQEEAAAKVQDQILIQTDLFKMISADIDKLISASSGPASELMQALKSLLPLDDVHALEPSLRSWAEELKRMESAGIQDVQTYYTKKIDGWYAELEKYWGAAAVSAFKSGNQTEYNKAVAAIMGKTAEENTIWVKITQLVSARAATLVQKADLTGDESAELSAMFAALTPAQAQELQGYFDQINGLRTQKESNFKKGQEVISLISDAARYFSYTGALYNFVNSDEGAAAYLEYLKTAPQNTYLTSGANANSLATLQKYFANKEWLNSNNANLTRDWYGEYANAQTEEEMAAIEKAMVSSGNSLEKVASVLAFIKKVKTTGDQLVQLQQDTVNTMKALQQSNSYQNLQRAISDSNKTTDYLNWQFTGTNIGEALITHYGQTLMYKADIGNNPVIDKALLGLNAIDQFLAKWVMPAINTALSTVIPGIAESTVAKFIAPSVVLNDIVQDGKITYQNYQALTNAIGNVMNPLSSLNFINNTVEEIIEDPGVSLNDIYETVDVLKEQYTAFQNKPATTMTVTVKENTRVYIEDGIVHLGTVELPGLTSANDLLKANPNLEWVVDPDTGLATWNQVVPAGTVLTIPNIKTRPGLTDLMSDQQKFDFYKTAPGAAFIYDEVLPYVLIPDPIFDSAGIIMKGAAKLTSVMGDTVTTGFKALSADSAIVSAALKMVGTDEVTKFLKINDQINSNILAEKAAVQSEKALSYMETAEELYKYLSGKEYDVAKLVSENELLADIYTPVADVINYVHKITKENDSLIVTPEVPSVLPKANFTDWEVNVSRFRAQVSAQALMKGFSIDTQVAANELMNQTQSAMSEKVNVSTVIESIEKILGKGALTDKSIEGATKLDLFKAEITQALADPTQKPGERIIRFFNDNGINIFKIWEIAKEKNIPDEIVSQYVQLEMAKTSAYRRLQYEVSARDFTTQQRSVLDEALSKVSNGELKNEDVAEFIRKKLPDETIGNPVVDTWSIYDIEMTRAYDTMNSTPKTAILGNNLDIYEISPKMDAETLLSTVEKEVNFLKESIPTAEKALKETPKEAKQTLEEIAIDKERLKFLEENAKDPNALANAYGVTIKTDNVESKELTKEQLAEVREVKAQLNKQLPKEIADSVTIVYDDTAIPDAVDLSAQSYMAKIGVNDAIAVAFADKHQKYFKFAEIKSETDLQKIAIERLEAARNANQYPVLTSNAQLYSSWNGWQQAMDETPEYSVYFKNMMMQVPVEGLVGRADAYVTPVNKVALRATYDEIKANPGKQFNYAKLYKKNLQASSTEAFTKETAASGKGYWIHIPRVSDVGSAQSRINVKALQELSPDTWCTHTWAAESYVNNYDNYLLMIDGKAVAGLEVRPDKTMHEVTSIANNGIASVDDLDDILAFCKSKNIYAYDDASAVKAAIEYKAKGLTNKEVFKMNAFDDDGPNEPLNIAEVSHDDWTPEFIRQQTLEDAYALHFVPRDLLTDDIVINALDHRSSYPDVINRLPEQFHTKEFIEKAIAHFVEVSNFQGLDILKDSEYLLKLLKSGTARNNHFSDDFLRGDYITQKIIDRLIEQDNFYLETLYNLKPEFITLNNFLTALKSNADDEIGLDIEQLFLTIEIDFSKIPKATLEKLIERYPIAAAARPYFNIPIIGDTGDPTTSIKNFIDKDLFVASLNKLSLRELNYQESATIRLLIADILDDLSEDTVSKLAVEIWPVKDLTAKYQTREFVEKVINSSGKSLNNDFLLNIPDKLLDIDLVLKAIDHTYYGIEVPAKYAKDPLVIERLNKFKKSFNDIDIDIIHFSKSNTGTVGGYYDPQLDRAVIVAKNVSKANAAKVALHELAHRGIVRAAREAGGSEDLRLIFGAAKNKLMEAAPELLERTGHKSLADLAMDYGFDINTPDGEMKILAELAARWAERFADKPAESWWNTLIVKIKVWVKKYLGKGLTNEDVDELVKGFIYKGVKPVDMSLMPKPVGAAKDMNQFFLDPKDGKYKFIYDNTQQLYREGEPMLRATQLMVNELGQRFTETNFAAVGNKFRKQTEREVPTVLVAPKGTGTFSEITAESDALLKAQAHAILKAEGIIKRATKKLENAKNVKLIDEYKATIANNTVTRDAAIAKLSEKYDYKFSTKTIAAIEFVNENAKALTIKDAIVTNFFKRVFNRRYSPKLEAVFETLKIEDAFTREARKATEKHSTVFTRSFNNVRYKRGKITGGKKGWIEVNNPKVKSKTERKAKNYYEVKNNDWVWDVARAAAALDLFKVVPDNRQLLYSYWQQLGKANYNALTTQEKLYLELLNQFGVERSILPQFSEALFMKDKLAPEVMKSLLTDMKTYGSEAAIKVQDALKTRRPKEIAKEVKDQMPSEFKILDDQTITLSLKNAKSKVPLYPNTKWDIHQMVPPRSSYRTQESRPVEDLQREFSEKNVLVMEKISRDINQMLAADDGATMVKFSQVVATAAADSQKKYAAIITQKNPLEDLGTAAAKTVTAADELKVAQAIAEGNTILVSNVTAMDKAYIAFLSKNPEWAGHWEIVTHGGFETAGITDNAVKTLVSPKKSVAVKDKTTALSVPQKTSVDIATDIPGSLKELVSKLKDESLVKEATPTAPALIVITNSDNATRSLTERGGAIVNGKLIIIEDDVLKLKFKEKAWTQSKITGVKPLPRNTFKIFEDYKKFVIDHERAHAGHSEWNKLSAVEQENLANDLALKQSQQLPEISGMVSVRLGDVNNLSGINKQSSDWVSVGTEGASRPGKIETEIKIDPADASVRETPMDTIISYLAKKMANENPFVYQEVSLNGILDDAGVVRLASLTSPGFWQRAQNVDTMLEQELDRAIALQNKVTDKDLSKYRYFKRQMQNGEISEYEFKSSVAAQIGEEKAAIVEEYLKINSKYEGLWHLANSMKPELEGTGAAFEMSRWKQALHEELTKTDEGWKFLKSLQEDQKKIDELIVKAEKLGFVGENISASDALRAADDGPTESVVDAASEEFLRAAAWREAKDAEDALEEIYADLYEAQLVTGMRAGIHNPEVVDIRFNNQNQIDQVAVKNTAADSSLLLQERMGQLGARPIIGKYASGIKVIDPAMIRRGESVTDINYYAMTLEAKENKLAELKRLQEDMGLTDSAPKKGDWYGYSPDSNDSKVKLDQLTRETNRRQLPEQISKLEKEISELKAEEKKRLDDLAKETIKREAEEIARRQQQIKVEQEGLTLGELDEIVFLPALKNKYTRREILINDVPEDQAAFFNLLKEEKIGAIVDLSKKIDPKLAEEYGVKLLDIPEFDVPVAKPNGIVNATQAAGMDKLRTAFWDGARDNTRVMIVSTDESAAGGIIRSFQANHMSQLERAVVNAANDNFNHRLAMSKTTMHKGFLGYYKRSSEEEILYKKGQEQISIKFTRDMDPGKAIQQMPKGAEMARLEEKIRREIQKNSVNLGEWKLGSKVADTGEPVLVLAHNAKYVSEQELRRLITMAKEQRAILCLPSQAGNQMNYAEQIIAKRLDAEGIPWYQVGLNPKAYTDANGVVYYEGKLGGMMPDEKINEIALTWKLKEEPKVVFTRDYPQFVYNLGKIDVDEKSIRNYAIEKVDTLKVPVAQRQQAIKILIDQMTIVAKKREEIFTTAKKTGFMFQPKDKIVALNEERTIQLFRDWRNDKTKYLPDWMQSESYKLKKTDPVKLIAKLIAKSGREQAKADWLKLMDDVMIKYKADFIDGLATMRGGAKNFTDADWKLIAKQERKAKTIMLELGTIYRVGMEGESLKNRIMSGYVDLGQALQEHVLRKINELSALSVSADVKQKSFWMNVFAHVFFNTSTVVNKITGGFRLLGNVFIYSVLYLRPAWHAKNAVDDGFRGALAAKDLKLFFKNVTQYLAINSHFTHQFTGDALKLMVAFNKHDPRLASTIEKIVGKARAKDYLRRIDLTDISDNAKLLRETEQLLGKEAAQQLAKAFPAGSGRKYDVFDLQTIIEKRKELARRGGRLDYLIYHDLEIAPDLKKIFEMEDYLRPVPRLDKLGRQVTDKEGRLLWDYPTLTTKAGEQLDSKTFDMMTSGGLYSATGDPALAQKIVDTMAETNIFQRLWKRLAVTKYDIEAFAGIAEHMRRATLVQELLFNKAMSIAEAKARTYGYLFNYNDLTVVGRIFKSVMPFYGFSANAIRLYTSIAIKGGPRMWIAAQNLLNAWNESTEGLPDYAKNRIQVGEHTYWYPWLSVWGYLDFFRNPSEKLMEFALNPSRGILGFGWGPGWNLFFEEAYKNNYWDLGIQLKQKYGWTDREIQQFLSDQGLDADLSKGEWLEKIIGSFFPPYAIIKALGEVDQYMLMDGVSIWKSKKIKEVMKFVFGINVFNWSTMDQFMQMYSSVAPHDRAKIREMIELVEPGMMDIISNYWAKASFINAWKNYKGDKETEALAELEARGLQQIYFDLEDQRKGSGSEWLERNPRQAQILQDYWDGRPWTPQSMDSKMRRAEYELLKFWKEAQKLIEDAKSLAKHVATGTTPDEYSMGNLDHLFDENGDLVSLNKGELEALAKDYIDSFSSAMGQDWRTAIAENVVDAKALAALQEKLADEEGDKAYWAKVNKLYALLPDNLSEMSDEAQRTYWAAYNLYFKNSFTAEEQQRFLMSQKPWDAAFKVKMDEYLSFWPTIISQFKESFDYYDKFFAAPKWIQELYFVEHPNARYYYPVAQQISKLQAEIRAYKERTGEYSDSLQKKLQDYIDANMGIIKKYWDQDDPHRSEFYRINKDLFDDNKEDYYARFFATPKWYQERFFASKGDDESMVRRYYDFRKTWEDKMAQDEAARQDGKSTSYAADWLWSESNSWARLILATEKVDKDHSKLQYYAQWRDLIQGFKDIETEGKNEFFTNFFKSPEWFKAAYFKANPEAKPYYEFRMALQDAGDRYSEVFFDPKYAAGRAEYDRRIPRTIEYMKLWKNIGGAMEKEDYTYAYETFFLPENAWFRERYKRNGGDLKVWALANQYNKITGDSWEDRKERFDFLVKHPALRESWAKNWTNDKLKLQDDLSKYFSFMLEVPENGKGMDYFQLYWEAKGKAEQFLDTHKKLKDYLESKGSSSEMDEEEYLLSLPPGIREAAKLQLEYFKIPIDNEDKMKGLNENYYSFEFVNENALQELNRKYWDLPQEERKAFLILNSELQDFWAVKKEQKAFLVKHPELQTYWDQKDVQKKFLEAHPLLAEFWEAKPKDKESQLPKATRIAKKGTVSDTPETIFWNKISELSSVKDWKGAVAWFFSDENKELVARNEENHPGTIAKWEGIRDSMLASDTFWTKIDELITSEDWKGAIDWYFAPENAEVIKTYEENNPEKAIEWRERKENQGKLDEFWSKVSELSAAKDWQAAAEWYLAPEHKAIVDKFEETHPGARAKWEEILDSIINPKPSESQTFWTKLNELSAAKSWKEAAEWFLSDANKTVVDAYEAEHPGAKAKWEAILENINNPQPSESQAFWNKLIELSTAKDWEAAAQWYLNSANKSIIDAYEETHPGTKAKWEEILDSILNPKPSASEVFWTKLNEFSTAKDWKKAAEWYLDPANQAVIDAYETDHPGAKAKWEGILDNINNPKPTAAQLFWQKIMELSEVKDWKAAAEFYLADENKAIADEYEADHPGARAKWQGILDSISNPQPSDAQQFWAKFMELSSAKDWKAAAEWYLAPENKTIIDAYEVDHPGNKAKWQTILDSVNNPQESPAQKFWAKINELSSAKKWQEAAEFYLAAENKAVIDAYEASHPGSKAKWEGILDNINNPKPSATQLFWDKISELSAAKDWKSAAEYFLSAQNKIIVDAYEATHPGAIAKWQGILNSVSNPQPNATSAFWVKINELSGAKEWKAAAEYYLSAANKAITDAYEIKKPGSRAKWEKILSSSSTYSSGTAMWAAITEKITANDWVGAAKIFFLPKYDSVRAAYEKSKPGSIDKWTKILNGYTRVEPIEPIEQDGNDDYYQELPGSDVTKPYENIDTPNYPTHYTPVNPGGWTPKEGPAELPAYIELTNFWKTSNWEAIKNYLVKNNMSQRFAVAPVIATAKYKAYQELMSTWIGLSKKSGFLGIYFFRSMPKWAQDMYLKRHPDATYLVRPSLVSVMSYPLQKWSYQQPDVTWAYQMMTKYGANMPYDIKARVATIMTTHGYWTDRSKWTKARMAVYWAERTAKMNGLQKSDFKNNPELAECLRQVIRRFPMMYQMKPFSTRVRKSTINPIYEEAIPVSSREPLPIVSREV